MRNLLFRFFLVSAVVCLFGLPAWGQVSPTGSISGTVVDPQGAVVSNASITAKNKATGETKTATSSDSGTYNIPAVPSGVYVVTVEMKGFKKTQVTDVKVDVGTPSTVNVTLEIGGAEETVTIVGGGEVIQTQSATIGTTLTGRQITDIPTASRDALDLVLALPGTTTVGRPRQSSVNGLPKGALNITMDGINVQDNLLKSNDGFFTYIRPRTDAISEVTVSTSNPGAESSGEGAFQIKFVTQGGGNQYHGGAYWYYRTPGLNSAYWFNNRDLPPDPVTGKAPRTDIILNQPGFKIGGPISIPGLFSGKDRAFFFANYEEYRLPESTLRTRNVISTAAQSGLYQFFSSTFTPPTTGIGAGTTTCTGSGTSRLCSVNVYQVIANAQANGTFVAANPGIVGAFTTVDPTINTLMSSIRSAVPATKTSGDPNVDQTTFVNKGGQKREFPTVRFDFNVTKKLHLENVWNYQNFGGVVDFLNNVDPAFPGFPNHGSQTSIRFSDSMGLRYTISNNIVNEAHYGIVGGTVLFFGEVGPGQFLNQAPNGQPQSISLSNFSSGGFGLTNATVTTGPQRRNSPVREFSDSLSWIKGNHSFAFGGSATRIAFWQVLQTVVPTSVFTSSASDSAPTNAFGTFGGVSFLPATQQAGAAQLYGLLSGRLTAFNSNVRLNEDTNKYSYLGPLASRAHSLEWGIFGQDSWRFRPNLTLTLGLRYERQVPITSDNNTYAGVSYADVFGESGVGNLFKPGCATNPCSAGAVSTLPAGHTPYTLFAKGTKAYNPVGILLPSIGFTYSPNWFKSGWMHRVFGESGQTVLRGGFSMASVREGTNVFQGVVGANPGGTLTSNRNLTLGNLPVGTYLRNGAIPGPTTCVGGLPVGCVPDAPTYPNFGLITDSVNTFNPNLKLGYVESWSFGIQREFKKDNVIEIRYTGNRGHKLWRQEDLNELNIVENGVAREFNLAQQNLLANIANGRGAQFRYQGPGTGTFPLPITFAYFQSTSASASACVDVASCNLLYSSGLFANSTFVNSLNPLNPAPLTYGQTLAGTGFDDRRTATGATCFGLTTHLNASGSSVAGCTGLGLFPYNMFYVNAGKRGDPFVVTNDGQSWYDAMTFEFRRRMAKGLLIQSSYTFGKSLSNTYASSSSVFDQPATFRNLFLKKGFSTFDIRHGFKTNFLYEAPFGKGKSFFSNAGRLMDLFVGGWGFNGNIRIQSGIPFAFNAPIAIGPGIQNSGNFQLVGMTLKDLQKAVGIYKDGVTASGAPDGFIYLLPKDIRDNTVKAFNIAISGSGASYTLGTPTGRFIAPAGYGNCQQSFYGQCGFANLVLHGPSFFRFDLALAKKIKVNERVNVEMRLEYLNAFNNINFQPGAAANDVNQLGGINSSSLSNSFGRMTAAYQDLSTTNDPGGRVGQLVLRINF